MSGKSLWPAVALVGMSLLSVVAILIFVPPENGAAGQAVTAILGLLGPIAAGMWVTSHVTAKVGEVKEQVNGRMSQILDKVPDATRDLPDTE